MMHICNRKIRWANITEIIRFMPFVYFKRMINKRIYHNLKKVGRESIFFLSGINKYLSSSLKDILERIASIFLKWFVFSGALGFC